jgi:hypothetical protein
MMIAGSAAKTSVTAVMDEVSYRNIGVDRCAMRHRDGKVDSMSGAEAEAVRAHVARITSSDLFAGAGRLCRFLCFTVEAKLGGHADQVKEYIIGREVFDRGSDYDTRLDPIVRVEARRLRSRLAEYYSGPGRNEMLRLEYPKGSYVPVIANARNFGSGRPRTLPPAVWIVGVAAAVTTVALLVGYAFLRPSPSAMIAPVPARWIEPNDGTLDAADVGLAEAVDAELTNQTHMRVVAWPEIARRQDLRGVPLRDVASQLGAAKLLVIVVRDLGAERRVSAFVIEEPTGRKNLALNYYTDTPLTTFAEQDALALRMARDLTARKMDS